MVASSTSNDMYEVTLERGTTKTIESLAPEWIDLCAEGPCDEPFFYPSWVSAYATAFQPGATIWLLTVRDQARLRAIFPFTKQSIGIGFLHLHWLRSTSNSHFPRFDVIHGAGDEQLVAQAIWKYLQARRDWDLLQFESAPKCGAAWRLLELARNAGHETRIHRPDASPYMDVTDLPSSVDAIIASQSKSLRSQLRRSMKRLQARGELDFRIVGHTSSPEELDDAIQALYRLEASGWKGKAGTAIVCDSRTERFYNLIVDAAVANQSLAICQLRCDGHLVATGLKLVWKGTMYELKPAYDEAYSDSSPGHIIRVFTVAAVTSMGIKVVDIGGRSDPHKLAWTKLSQPFATCFVANRTLPGRVAWMTLFRLGPMVRQRNVPIPKVIKRLIE